MAYTYLIGWSKHNKFYYGARWAKDCSPDDLWNTYFTSSKHVKAFRKEHGEPNIIQVRKVFNDTDKCKLYERKTLEKLNVLNSDKWLNKNINGMFLPCGPQSEEHIKKRIDSLIKNGKLKGVVSWTKISNPEYAKKVSDSLKNKPKSAAHVASMRKRPQDTTVLTCSHCDKTGDYKNMKRWHMERCKHNPNRVSDIDPKLVTCTKCGHTANATPNFYRYHNEHCQSTP
jgi:hypothetical protein